MKQRVQNNPICDYLKKKNKCDLPTPTNNPKVFAKRFPILSGVLYFITGRIFKGNDCIYSIKGDYHNCQWRKVNGEEV